MKLRSLVYLIPALALLTTLFIIGRSCLGQNATGAPTLTSPANGATNVATPVTLTWQAGAGETGARVQTCRDATFATGTVMLDTTEWGVTSLQLTPAMGAIPGMKVYWRIAALKDAADAGVWSPAWSFTAGTGTTTAGPPGAARPPVAPTAAQTAAGGDIVKVGAGSYQIANVGPVETPSHTDNMKAPFPTNDWDSSLLWAQYSSKMYAHPLVMLAGSSGMRIAYPTLWLYGTGDAIMGNMDDKGNDFIIGMAGAGAFPDAKADSMSDWFATAAFVTGDKSMKLTFGHGSPFIYGLFTGGDPTLTFPQAPTVWSGDAKSAVVGITTNGKHYGLFGPTGSTWTGLDTATLECNTNGKTYFSVALLPDNKPETLALFKQYAYSHVTDTKVAWNYDEKTSIVTTTFTFTTKQYEGTQTGVITALYPHQWTRSDAKLLPGTYTSVRGTMKITACDSFTTKVPFPGVLPVLPNKGTYDRDTLLGFIRADVARVPTGGLEDTYAEGKNFGRTALLASIADTVEDPASDKAYLDNVKTRLEQYLTANHFKYNPTWGTLIGYPASFGSDNSLNDHHFHYGYFIRAAAEVARQDPAWAKDDQWGGMIKMLIRDCACPDHDDPLFPFLRNYDPYEGHSWANGKGLSPDGNDNESSSEGIDAWTGILLWGEMTGDVKLRDLGIYLYTSEMEGIDNYWFDVRGTNLIVLPGYRHKMASLNFGGKSTFGTWFSGDPTWMHVINYMPVQPGSLYLGDYPDYVKINYESLVAEKGGTDFGNIADIVFMYRALYDAPGVVKDCNFNTCPLESGNSRANLYYWCHNLNALGTVDISITADTPLYAVFKKDTTRTYVAYNATGAPLKVTFSDGKTISIEKNGFGVDTGKVK